MNIFLNRIRFNSPYSGSTTDSGLLRPGSTDECAREDSWLIGTEVLDSRDCTWPGILSIIAFKCYRVHNTTYQQ